MNRNSSDKPSAGEISRPVSESKKYGLFTRSALAIVLSFVCAKEVSAKTTPHNSPGDNFKRQDNPTEIVSESKDGITLDTLKEKGKIIKRIEKDFKEIKTICVNFQSARVFTEQEAVFINKLVKDYGLPDAKNTRDNLVFILDYMRKNFAEYCDILISLLTSAQILNAIECEGCYEDVIKTFFDAAGFYNSKKLEVISLKEGL